MPMDTTTYLALGLDQATPADVNGRSNADIAAALNHPGDDAYHPCAEAYPREGTAAGEVTGLKGWANSAVYPGTARDIWIYASAGATDGAPVYFFNDGGAYLSRQGAVRATTVFDNLVADGALPPLVAVFVNPGIPGDEVELTPPTSSYTRPAAQRALEYDALTPRYAEFLLEDVEPLVSAQLGIALSQHASDRTVCGISSGGICAFNVAWHCPGQFARVISHCGSFTNIMGGHHFPYLVRSTVAKPLRIYLQSGANDGRTVFGDWPLANQTMAAALDYAGYDFEFDFGTGGHTLRHGGATFAKTLRWLRA